MRLVDCCDEFYSLSNPPPPCRGVSDQGVGTVLTACPSLARLAIWGDTQLTGAVFLPLRAGVRSTGNGSAAWAGASVSDQPLPLQVIGRPGDPLPTVEFT